MKTLPKELFPTWHKASECLPEDSRFVLIYSIHSGYDVGFYVQAQGIVEIRGEAFLVERSMLWMDIPKMPEMEIYR